MRVESFFADQLVSSGRTGYAMNGLMAEPHPRLTRPHAAQGGVTLELEQRELGANFCHLGRYIGVVEYRSQHNLTIRM
jgi:hypothetical protein